MMQLSNIQMLMADFPATKIPRYSGSDEKPDGLEIGTGVRHGKRKDSKKDS
jgi:hypothetical protein